MLETENGAPELAAFEDWIELLTDVGCTAELNATLCEIGEVRRDLELNPDGMLVPLE